MENKIKRALVISGGGAKGAWAGGLVQQFIEERGYDWDMYFGTSTGSLVITLTPLKEMERLKKAYTSVSNEDIFSVNPFTKGGKIRVCNAICRIIGKKTSLGEAGGLKKILANMFTEDDYNRAKVLGKSMYPCVTNYTLNGAEYVCSMNTPYAEYVEYTIASTSVPLAMDLVPIDGSSYLDGGVVMHVPVQKAIDEGADEIDVVVLRPEKIDSTPWKAKNMFDVLMRTIDLMENQISQTNVLVGQLKAHEKDVKLRIRYTPYKLADNSLVFSKEQMEKWWKEGYEYGRVDGASVKVMLRKTLT